MRREHAIVTDLTITRLAPAPLHALEIWSNPHEVAARMAALGVFLPALGKSATCSGMTLIRFEPTVWLVEGDVAALGPVLGEDGALTAIGGGIVRVRIAGAGWRRLLMEGGFFDAESPGFATGCSAASIIDHVALRLWVESDYACVVYVPASYAAGLVRFWEDAVASF
jgi:heterotetrameric sarcosine oxidase gamma subunit